MELKHAGAETGAPSNPQENLFLVEESDDQKCDEQSKNRNEHIPETLGHMTVYPDSDVPAEESG